MDSRRTGLGWFEEAPGVELFAVGTPDGIGVDEGPGDHEDGVFFQEVLLGEDGVLDDPARGGGLGAVAEEFEVGGEEERAGGFEGCDVDFVLLFQSAVGR